jgi:hypothetical protein
VLCFSEKQLKRTLIITTNDSICQRISSKFKLDLIFLSQKISIIRWQGLAKMPKDWEKA